MVRHLTIRLLVWLSNLSRRGLSSRLFYVGGSSRRLYFSFLYVPGVLCFLLGLGSASDMTLLYYTIPVLCFKLPMTERNADSTSDDSPCPTGTAGRDRLSFCYMVAIVNHYYSFLCFRLCFCVLFGSLMYYRSSSVI